MKKIILVLTLFVIVSDASAQPTITTFSPSCGPIGTMVSIHGTNFNSIAGNNVVYFGAVKANVISSTEIQLNVTVPQGATYQPFTVTDITTGLTACSNKPFTLTFPCEDTINAGSFAAKTDFATGDGTQGIAIGDLDEDGKPDIVATNSTDNTISVYRNTSVASNISFAPKLNISVGRYPFRVRFADIDGDGKLDIVVASQSGDSLTIIRNLSIIGTLSFSPKAEFNCGFGQNGLAIAEIDGDGKLDIVVCGGHTASVFRNTSTIGNISLSFAIKLTTTGGSSFDVVTADFDRDGKHDLATTNRGSNTVSLFRNTGNFTFASTVDLTTGNTPTHAAVGDLDVDELPDLVITNERDSTLSVYRNTSSREGISFTAQSNPVISPGPYGIAIDDLNGDGKPDLAVTDHWSTWVSILRNTSSAGAITFGSKVDWRTGCDPLSIVVGDIDGDVRPDIVFTNYCSQSFSVLRNMMKSTPSNYALQFDGVNDFVQTATSVSQPTAFTIMLSFKTTATNGGVLIGANENQNGSGGKGERRIYLNNAGQIYFGVYSSGVQTIHSSASFNDGKWHHVTGEMSAEGMKLFIDGNLEASNSVVTDEIIYSKYWIFGYTDLINDWPSRPSSFYYNGVIDDVSIWNFALPQNQIQNYMKNPPIGNESGLLYEWTFNEGIGATTNDATGNGNIGTLLNGVTWVHHSTGETILENDSVKITIADIGGKVIGWYVKRLNKNIVSWSDNSFYAVLAQRFTVFEDTICDWPGGWPTLIGSEKYQTEILPPNDQEARVKQSLTISPPSIFAGLKIEKYYTLTKNSYELDVDFVITNTSDDTIRYINYDKEYGISLTLETTMLCGANYAIAFKSGDSIYTGPFPPINPNPSFKMKIDWCAIEEKESGYVLGTFFCPDSTFGLWPGEERSNGRDYEIIFRPVKYQPGCVVTYHVRTCGGPGTIQSFAKGELSNPTKAKPNDDKVPKEFMLSQNYPNPFNPVTTLSYNLPERSTVRLFIFNILGQKVSEIVNETKDAGYYEHSFIASQFSSGIYFYRIEAASAQNAGKTFVQTKKMVLMK